MSKIIPPMVSSSPPPMDDNLDDEDEDDEFGTFSTADFSYDLDITQPSKPSTNGAQDTNIRDQCDLKSTILIESGKKEGLNNSYDGDFSHQNGTHSSSEIFPHTEIMKDREVRRVSPGAIEDSLGSREIQQDNTSQDSIVSAATDSGLCSASQESEGTSPLPPADDGLRVPVLRNQSQEESSSSDETVARCFDSGLEIIQSNAGISDGIEVDIEINHPPTHTDILNYSNCIGKPFDDSRQINREKIGDQLPIVFSDSSSHAIVDDYLEISDCQLKINNIPSDKSIGSVLNNLCISDGTIGNLTDQSVTDPSFRQEQFYNTTSSSVTRKVPFLDESRKLFSQEINVPVSLSNNETSKFCDQSGFEPDQVRESDGSDSTNVDVIPSSSFETSNLTASNKSHQHEEDEFGSFENVSIKPSSKPSESCDNFTGFRCSEASSLPLTTVAVNETHEVVDSSDEFADFAYSEVPPLSLNTTSVNMHLRSVSLESDNEFADLSCRVPPSFPLKNKTTATTRNIVCDADDEFADFTSSKGVSSTLAAVPVKESNESHECDDEFADFTSSVAPSFSATIASEDSRWASVTAMQTPSVLVVADQLDEFDDFETAGFTSSVIPTPFDSSQLSSRLENVVTSLFPGPGEAETAVSSTGFISRGPMVDQNPVWGDLQDVDTSHALTYQWVSSSANKMLLSALGIDTRNILFGSKWNVAVPRFAANLGVSPLEPVRARSPPLLLPTGDSSQKPSQFHPEATTSTTRSEEIVPDAQFDWNSSGLVNPLDCMEKDGDRTTASGQRTGNNGRELLTIETHGSHTGLSSEAVKLLQSLPNLSFLHSKTLVFPPPGLTVLQR